MMMPAAKMPLASAAAYALLMRDGARDKSMAR